MTHREITHCPFDGEPVSETARHYECPECGPLAITATELVACGGDA